MLSLFPNESAECCATASVIIVDCSYRSQDAEVFEVGRRVFLEAASRTLHCAWLSGQCTSVWLLALTRGTVVEVLENTSLLPPDTAAMSRIRDGINKMHRIIPTIRDDSERTVSLPNAYSPPIHECDLTVRPERLRGASAFCC